VNQNEGGESLLAHSRSGPVPANLDHRTDWTTLQEALSIKPHLGLFGDGQPPRSEWNRKLSSSSDELMKTRS
jgi:hypothetical protein